MTTLLHVMEALAAWIVVSIPVGIVVGKRLRAISADLVPVEDDQR